MLICIASLIRDAAQDMTLAGKNLIELTNKLIEEHKMSRAKTPSEKKEMSELLGKALIEEIKKTEAHGTSTQATEEFIETVNDLVRAGNLRNLMMYPYNWALAWKYKIKASDADIGVGLVLQRLQTQITALHDKASDVPISSRGAQFQSIVDELKRIQENLKKEQDRYKGL